MTTTAADYLETYLQDHRAGAAMGADLARRLVEENAGTPYESFLVGVAQEIEQDIGVLDDIMSRFDISKANLKIAGAKVVERLGRLKPNEQFTSYSPLSRVLELEALRGGVQGKLALWDALAVFAADDERLGVEEIAGLQAKAQRQLDGLRTHHTMAAHEAFAQS